MTQPDNNQWFMQDKDKSKPTPPPPPPQPERRDRDDSTQDKPFVEDVPDLIEPEYDWDRE
mgnify:CR=1 FL=1